MRVDFSKEEREQIYELASRLTGTCQEGRFRHSVLVTNVGRRVQAIKASSLAEYLEYACQDDNEYERLISALTIHTTSWFRESPHYERIEQDLLRNPQKFKGKKYRVFSGACSTGEEVYSAALVLEQFRQRIEGFDYEIVGMDIDKVSVQKARNGIYEVIGASGIPSKYHRWMLRGSGQSEGLFTFTQEIKERCKFSGGNLKKLKSNGGDTYDLVICRNVLIYFSPEDVESIVKTLITMLSEDGLICLGHSEALEPAKYGVKSLGNSCYSKPVVKKDKVEELSVIAQPPRVLVVDDSATVRASLQKLFGGASFDVTAVPSADVATQAIAEKSFDIVTLDLHMPGEDGKSWLERQRRAGLRVPVVILSGASPQEATDVLGALENGAQDYLDKVMLQKDSEEVVDRIRQLATQYRSVSKGALSKKKSERQNIKAEHPDLIMIGASTGGTEVLAKLLRHMPNNTPPVLVAQHITPNFAAAFGRRLADVSGLKLTEMKQGTPLERGHIYIALEDYHIGVNQNGGRLNLTVSHEGPVNRHRPSVDFMFKTGAALRSTKILAMLLTGMGSDGARGLLALKDAGAVTMAQDEASCVVYGMPKEAVKLGAAQYVADPGELKNQLLASVSAMPGIRR